VGVVSLFCHATICGARLLIYPPPTRELVCCSVLQRVLQRVFQCVAVCCSVKLVSLFCHGTIVRLDFSPPPP